MIYDCFQFYNELDLLRLRMHALDAVVDRFVICEATVTFSGHAKPLYYAENRVLFKKFQHKTVHLVINDTPEVSPFEIDIFQKRAVRRGLEECAPSDVVLFSDLDEIPNPAMILKQLETFDDQRIYHFAQRMFYFYLNLEEVSGNLLSYTGEFDGVEQKRWLGTKMFSAKLLRDYELDQLRSPERKSDGIRVEPGGWHFSYMGGDKSESIADRVTNKIRFAAHQEYNTPEVLSRVESNIKRGRDIFGRKSRFVRVDIDGSYPAYLVQNMAEFNHLILPPSRKQKLLDRLSR